MLFMHIQSRAFFDLERLWKDCPQVDLQLEHPFTLADDDQDGQLASKADDLNGDDLRSRFADPQDNHD